MSYLKKNLKKNSYGNMYCKLIMREINEKFDVKH